MCPEHSEDGYLPAGLHAAFGLHQPAISVRWMHFKVLLLRERAALERRQVFTVSTNLLRPALRSVRSFVGPSAPVVEPLLKKKLIIIFGYFVPTCRAIARALPR